MSALSARSGRFSDTPFHFSTITHTLSSLIMLSSRDERPLWYHPLPFQSLVTPDTSTFDLLIYNGHVRRERVRAEDFMRRYMWPNSCLPSATALISTAYSASQGRFTLEGVENHAARE